MAVFHRIVNERKRSDTRFSGYLRPLLIVHNTTKYSRYQKDEIRLFTTVNCIRMRVYVIVFGGNHRPGDFKTEVLLFLGAMAHINTEISTVSSENFDF